jgi:hypothetical protein
MATKKKLLQAAAGNIVAGGGEAAEGVSFDGNDELIRSSNLTGATDGKTFTFSAWVYDVKALTSVHHIIDIDDYQFKVAFESGFRIQAQNSSGTNILVATSTSIDDYFQYAWTHVLISIDLSSTYNRKVYINDVDVTSLMTWTTYTNDNIGFTASPIGIASNSFSSQNLKGRLAHVYLDYTYRDLSVEENRRLFITDDLKPADGLSNTVSYVANYDDFMKHLNAASGFKYTFGSSWNSDGTAYISSGNQNDSIYKFTLGTAYDLTTIQSVSTYNHSVYYGVMTYTPDGSKFFWLDYYNDQIHQVTPTTAYGINGSKVSKSIEANIGNGNGIFFNSDGTKFYILASTTLYEYTPGSAYTINSSITRTDTISEFGTQMSSDGISPLYAATMSTNGEYIYVHGTNTADGTGIFQYPLSTAYDPSTIGSKSGFFAHPYVIKDMSISTDDKVIGLTRGLNTSALGNNFGYAITMSSANDLSTAEWVSTGSNVNPILYLPLTDADTAGTNEGTGGDFTVNGVLDTAQRGPNQWNCVASEFDGNVDILYNDGQGLLDTKVISFSANFRVDVYPGTGHVLYVGNSSGLRRFVVYLNSTGLIVEGFNSSSATILKVTYPKASVALGRHYSLQFSCDLTDTQKRHFILDGMDLDSEVTWSTYTNENINFNTTYDTVAVGALRNSSPAGSALNASIGEVYLDTTYIDLAADNPFWDSDTNKPKPVRQVLDETGNIPVVALPIAPSNAGLNLGTGSNFSASSGPYPGARGGSEFWVRSAKIGDDNTNNDGFFKRTTPFVGGGSTNQFTLIFHTTNNVTTNGSIFMFESSTGHTANGRFEFADTNDKPYIYVYSGGVVKLAANGGTNGSMNRDSSLIMFSCDLSNTSKRHLYLNGFAPAGGVTWSTYADGSVDFSACDDLVIGAETNDDYRAELGFVYFAPEYIDFSQESNRNLFVDQLGYPKDLTPAIDDGDIPSPLVYMKFDDPDNLGANSGTGGDFTKYGAIVQGADIDPNA